jgi:hypothetical protein
LVTEKGVRRYHRGMTRPHLLAAASLVAALGAVQPATAQYGVTLYGGARAGGGFEQANPPNNPVDMRSSAAGSIGIDWPYDASRQFQLLLSYQRTQLELGTAAPPGGPTEMPLQVSYIHLGGLNFFEGQLGRGPYVAGGIGATMLNPNLPGTSSRVRPSFNVGIGYQWPLSGSLALRSELRGYITAINSSGSFFCSGGCVVQIQSTVMTQFEAMLGLTFGF